MNYNSLMNKPTINYRELIGDNSVTEVGGITEEQFNTLLNTDLSSYYTKAQIDDLFSRSFVYREKSGSIVTFDCPESTTSGITKVVSNIVAIQSGTGDPSPTNIRPISGWSAVNRYRTNKNMFSPSSIAQGTYDSTTNVWTISAPVSLAKAFDFSFKENTQYTFSGTSIQNNASKNVRLVIVYTDDTFTNIWATNSTEPIDFATTSTANKTIKEIQTRYGTSDIVTINNFQIEVGTSASEYVTPNGTTYTTTLKDGQDNPLTCYGGTLSNENGAQSLVLTHGYIASYNGETLPSTWISDRDVYAEGTTPTTGAEVVYALATSQQITQDTLSITSIAGINNIWCDSGDITVKALDKIIQG